MNSTIKDSPRMILAELLKLKKTPALYLILAGALFTATIVFLAHSLDVHNMVKLNMNPWDRYFRASLSVYTLFLIVPYLILLLSASTYIENRANSLKYLYTLPYRRGQFFFAKLITILFLVIASIFLTITLIISSAYLLQYLVPEFEFAYYPPNLLEIARQFGSIFIACLGIIGWQYLLCLTAKNFLVPLGVGILGYVTSLILAITSHPIAIYSPYAYPLQVKDLDMFKNENIKEDLLFGLNNIECYSLLCFIICIVIAYVYEGRKNVVN